MKRSSIGLLVAAAIVAVNANPGLADNPAPNTALVKVNTAAGARALLSTLRARPKRVVRLPAAATSAVALTGQVISVLPKKLPSADLGAIPRCVRSPLQIDRVSGNVTPGGTVTIHGSCFGTAAGGEVQLHGDFPSGMLRLTVTAWSDDAVSASVPAVTGVPDLPVGLRLSALAPTEARTAVLRGQRVAVAAIPARIVSDPVAMRFTATRETTTLWSTNLENVSCARAPNVSNVNADDCRTAAIGYWTLYGNEHSGEHVRMVGYKDAGEDLWHMRVPAGWRFDHIEFQAMSAATDIVISPTLDPSNVTWRVRWKTETRDAGHPLVADGSSGSGYNVEDGSYLGMVYITGPAGTMKH